ncbi:MAG TPA: DMT family transporter [Burkholderiaceae bacterium]
MSLPRTLILTTLAMIAFAGNSLLCRAALRGGGMDPASFTAVRLVAGALTLWVLVRLVRGQGAGQGNAGSALALFAYAICFSYAYVSLPTATGALLLFAAVQATMIGYGLWAGERLRGRQTAGLVLAASGLLGLLLPGIAAPPVFASLLMIAAGAAWGVYSLRGRGAGAPLKVTAGNFLRAALLAVPVALLMRDTAALSTTGWWCAVASGALTSAIGYAIWYTALPALRATSAATVQLSVPAIAAFGGVAFLGEGLSLRLVLASAAILGGIALVLLGKTAAPRP